MTSRATLQGGHVLAPAAIIGPRAQGIKRYHVFIASPGDVGDERRAVRKFFQTYNLTYAEPRGVHFEVVDWENYSSAGVGRPQELITKQTLERYKESLALVIGIMGQRFGSQTGTHESGTEEEFEWAVKSQVASGFPEVKWFFRTVENLVVPAIDPDPAVAQWKEVQAFRKRIDNEKRVYSRSYKTLEDFQALLEKDVARWLNSPDRLWFAPGPPVDESTHRAVVDDLIAHIHLIDRGGEQAQFEATLNKAKREHKHVVVCFVHGMAADKHKRFLARLKELSLLTLFSDEPAYSCIKEIEFPMEQQAFRNGFPYLGNQLTKFLGAEFDEHKSVVTELDSGVRPRVFSSELRLSLVSRAQRILLEQWLNYWKRVAAHNPQNIVIVFVGLVAGDSFLPKFLNRVALRGLLRRFAICAVTASEDVYLGLCKPDHLDDWAGELERKKLRRETCARAREIAESFSQSGKNFRLRAVEESVRAQLTKQGVRA